MKLYCLLRFVFSVNFAFIKFATDLSAKRKSRFLAWNVFFFVNVLHISERSFRNKFNSSHSDCPKNFDYLFILLNRNSINLNLNIVSRNLKRKRKAHTKKRVFQHEILKLMAKRFKRAFYLFSNCCSL